SSGTPIEISDHIGRAPIAAISESETASALWPRRYGGVVVRRKSMSSTSRSAVITVSFPALLRKIAASSPMPAINDSLLSPDDVTRCRNEAMKSNSLFEGLLWACRGAEGCSCSSFILKDYDEANRVLLRLSRSKLKTKTVSDSHPARRKRCPARLRPARD